MNMDNSDYAIIRRWTLLIVMAPDIPGSLTQGPAKIKEVKGVTRNSQGDDEMGLVSFFSATCRHMQTPQTRWVGQSSDRQRHFAAKWPVHVQ